MAASVDNRQYARLEPGLNGVVRSYKPPVPGRSDSPKAHQNQTTNQTVFLKPAKVHDDDEDVSSEDENETHNSNAVYYKEMIRKSNAELEPSVLDPRDEYTADSWIERNPSMVRLTGKHPFNSEAPLNRLMHHGFITPVPLHYVRNHGHVPKAQWAEWTVEVTGFVKRPMKFTMDQLVSEFAYREFAATLVCAGNRRKEQNMVKKSKGFNWGSAGVSTSVWRGVPLCDVLRRCGIFSRKGGALNVCFEGSEDLPGGAGTAGSKYGTSIKKEYAMDPSRDIILAYMQNGEYLTPDHGFPVRIIIPGFIGGRMVKWLKRIIVTTKESDNFYHFKDNRVLPSLVDAELADEEGWWYKPEYIINELNINSVITTPCHEEILPINAFTTQRPYTLKGYAYSGGGKKVTRVEVTVDGGETWNVCALDHQEKPNKYGKFWCWCFWSLEVEVLDLLSAKEIAVRAWDETLNTQPEKMIWNLMGMMNNCWFRVKTNVCKPHKGEIGIVFEHPTLPGNESGGWMAKERHLEKSADAPPSLKKSVSTPFMNTTAKMYSMSEVKKHNSADSCWIIVHGHIYDCTRFLMDHPGGSDSILINAGTDCTEEFEAIHSDKAKKMLEDYRIGELITTGYSSDSSSPNNSVHGSSAVFSLLAPIGEATPVRNLALVNPRAKVPVQLVEKTSISHDVRKFRFALPVEDMVLGLPVGKHIFLCATINDKLCLRAYTPSSTVDVVGYFELVVKIYFGGVHPRFPNGGLMSQYLDSLPIGSTLEIKGPLGHVEYLGKGSFTVHGKPKFADKLAMLAGGTGITPVYQIIQAILKDPEDETEMYVIYANRTEEDILLREELDGWAEQYPDRLKVWYVVESAKEGWAYSTGFISEAIMREHIPDGLDGSALAMACGPPPMIQFAQTQKRAPNSLASAIEDMVVPQKKFANGKRNDSTKSFKPMKKPFKKTKDDVAARSEAMALQLEDVPDFPRGGGTSLSKKEREKLYEEVDAEFDADERVSKKSKGGKSKKRIPSDLDDLGLLFGGGLHGKRPRYANKITTKNISPGMKLLGVVTEVNQKDIVISLPGGLRGLVRASEVSDFTDRGIEDDENELLGDIFSVGQLVPCIVLELDDDKKEAGKRKIWLSLRLSLLHKGFSFDSFQLGMVFSANVKSIEDHGSILHFGLPSITGFIEISDDGNQESGMKTGQLIQGVVTKIDRDRKIVHLSSDPDSVAKCLTKDLSGMSFDLLIPGMMVNARVQSVLENGILFDFLTYFNGTVDLFHLKNPLSNKSWKDEYNQNKTVNARILFIDPSSRAVGLTLSPHVVCNKAPPLHVFSGDIFDEAKVVRIDKSGLLLELPSKPTPTPAYVSTYDAAGDEVTKLEKKFKEGNHIRVRVLGLKQMEGLAVGTLKESAFEGPVFTHSDVKPGMVTKAKVISVDTFGAIVQFSGGLKAMCPLRHMSEFEVTKPRKKFKVGAELVFRVLGCKSKRITVTYKKTLVKSKLPILSSYTDATEGLVTHGWITKIEKHGCFVRFYNGVQGFVPRFELGLEPGSDPDSVFHVGEVVKCRVTSAVHGTQRITLSFMIKPSSVSEDDSIKLGSIVSGIIDTITSQAVIVRVKSKSVVKGTISAEHLADHHEQAKLIMSLLRPGYELDKLLVLDIEGNNMALSSKYSLIKLAEELPSDFNQLQPNSVVHGYVCNLIENGCFVRFLGRLTGFAPRSKAIDDPKADVSESFFVGQSVRANIVDVNQEKSRITLSLKQSSCASVDASFVQEYFLMDEKISDLQSSDITKSDCSWVEKFSIGSLIKGTIQEQNDLGVVVNFDNINNVLGFIPQHHMGGATLVPGSVVNAVVLDISRAERLVDLSLRPELLNNLTKEVSNSSKKKRKRGISKELEVHQRVSAVVEIVKEQHLVLSIPEHGYTIGYASVSDYNTQKLPVKQFSTGQSVVASVKAVQNPLTSGRLLLLLDSVSGTSETSRSKRAKKKSSCEVGSVVHAEITEIKPFELRVNFGNSFRGRIHITEVNDASTSDEPFAKFRVGQSISARVVAKPCHTDIKKTQLWELSVKPAMLKDSSEFNDTQESEQLEFAAGQCVIGYVYKVDKEWVWLAVSRNVTARIFILDTSCKAHELEEFERRFPIGKAVSGYVLTYNKEKKTLRLVQRPLLFIHKSIANGGGSKTDKPDSSIPGDDDTLFIHEGDILGGRISKILPGVGGLRVQLGPYVFGRVHFTEINDSWVPDPLDGFREGQFVKCKVLEISSSSKGTWQIELSLRTSLDGMSSADHLSEDLKNNDNVCKRFERIEDLSPDMGVQGYVKNTMSKGCFIILSRTVEAKVRLSNLCDTFVKEPEKEFPVGKLVTGRVLNVEPLSKRIEVTLKTVNAGGRPKSESYDLKKLHVGDMISGRIRRVEPFGLFIDIDQTGMVGLCHISQLSDDRMENVQARYKAGESVRAKILKLDEEKKRISLGMKSSYLMNGDDDKAQPLSEDNTSMECDPINDPKSEVLAAVDDFGFQETSGGTSLVLAQVESRASIPPLEVDLDDIEETDFDSSQNQEKLLGANKDEKSKRREKQKDKEEREKKIQAAEGRLLEHHAPENADEFEKLVRSSPNSSFVWIKYMAFMLSLADIEKARSIAERALRTINIREEEEKLNIWVAYFNLENEHGNPPEESVKKVFERARQYCDPKKVYLALLGVYERTEQYKLADKLLDEMIKKFKQSCKIWLRKIQSSLKQNEEAIQSVVNRALLCLPRHKHIKFISQTAILEFKCGVADRGRSLFEGVLREYPKRTDLWSVYLDQEIRLGEDDVIRSLFERAISLSLPPKKMKFLFKKFLEYEKSVGDEERVEYVKQRAMEYANSTLA